MTGRHYPVGSQFSFEKDGLTIRFRVTDGNHIVDGGTSDGILEWFVSGEWRPFPVELLLYVAGYMCENEESRHPGGRGGRLPLDYIELAWKKGYPAALELLRKDRAQRHRPALFSG